MGRVKPPPQHGLLETSNDCIHFLYSAHKQVKKTKSMAKADSDSKKIQMVDIARMAGVSSSTVSRALSGSALIPEATRERILELAKSLNYQVNVGAANLRTRSVQPAGVVVLGDSMQAISDPFILSLFGSVADALDEQGASVLLTRWRSSWKLWVLITSKPKRCPAASSSWKSPSRPLPKRKSSPTTR